jgi:hypothetical protein
MRDTYIKQVGSVLHRYRYKKQDMEAIEKLDKRIIYLEDLYTELKYKYYHISVNYKNKMTEIRRAICKVKEQLRCRTNYARMRGSYDKVIGRVENNGSTTLLHEGDTK